MKCHKMKAWIITMAFPDPSETFACNDILALQKLGLQVAVHGLRPKNPLFLKLIAERGLQGIWITHNSVTNSLQGMLVGLIQPLLLMNLILLIVRHSWKRPVNLLKSLILVPQSLNIFRLIQKQKPDIVHLYWSHFPALVGYLVQQRMPSMPVSIAFVAHDVYDTEFNTKDSYSGVVARRADLIQSITAANIPEIEKFGIPKEKILVSYHGVDFNKIIGAAKKVPRRLVTAGRLIPDKGFDFVLEAFSQILRIWPDASLVILGDGPERQHLESLARSLKINHAVVFRGFVSHDNIFEEMAIAEVFLFMSKAERLPNVVKEAMACRCLCVTSYTPGIEELIHDQIHGYIVQQGDVKTAVDRIHRAFSNQGEMQQMTEIAYQYLYSHFNLDQTIESLYEKWQQIIVSKKYDDWIIDL